MQRRASLLNNILDNQLNVAAAIIKRWVIS